MAKSLRDCIKDNPRPGLDRAVIGDGYGPLRDLFPLKTGVVVDELDRLRGELVSLGVLNFETVCDYRAWRNIAGATVGPPEELESTRVPPSKLR